MADVKIYDTIVKSEPITKGWSEDKKYYAETENGQRLFLRVSDIAEYNSKKAEYEMMGRVYNHGVCTPRPVEFGLCDDGKSVYQLSEWLDGMSADVALSKMSDAEQYELGVKSGELLRKIHSIPAPDNTDNWGVRFDKKLKTWFDEYNSKPEIHSETGEMIVRYLKKHRNVLDIRTQTLVHGDYNIENIIVMPDGEVKTIDFNGFNTHYCDPWWDMNNMAWMPVMFPYFYTGQIKGRLNGEPPEEFWRVFTYYLAYDALAALTDPYGLNGIEDGTEIVQNILTWTDNFRNVVPTWYLKD